MINLKIAWRDIMRQPLRLGLTIAAITFCALALIVMMAFSRGGHQNMIQSSVSTFTGHFQMQAEGYHDDPSLYKSFEVPEEALDELAKNERVKGAAPRIMTQGLASSDESTAGVMIVGVDPRREKNATTLADRVREGKFLDADVPESVVLGKTLADNMSVKIGDEIQVMTQSFYGSLELRWYTVRGLVKTGNQEFDRALLVMPLGELQSLIQMEGLATEVAVVLESPRGRDEVMNEARTLLGQAGAKDLLLLPWEEVTPELYEFVLLDDAFAVLYIAVLVIIVAFIVMLTITMSVLERIKEFGVLLAIGTKPARVFTIIMLESLMMGIIGSVAGMLIGGGIAQYFHAYPYYIEGYVESFEQFGMEPMIQTILMPEMFLGTAAIMMVIVMSVSIFPALRASRTEPVEALRHV